MRDKLIWKFLAAYVPLILLAVFVLNFFVSFSLRNHFEEQITQQLQSNSLLVGSIIQEDIKNKNYSNIQKQVMLLSKKLDLRITVIDNTGIVLGDSQRNPEKMENHGDRPEVTEAFKNGLGISKRFSDTLNYNMKYVATSLGNREGVIRLAIALRQVDTQIRVIYRAVLIGGLIAAFLMIILGYYISKSITNPIGEMKTIAQRISHGDFSKKLDVKRKDELGSLARSLNRMADDLQTQIESLKKMDQVRTDFVANVSHELKTPLTSIKGYVETLRDGALEDTENADKFLKIINKHVDSLTNIVDDLLALSEVELKGEKLKKEIFDLKTLLDEVIQSFEHTFQERNLDFEFLSEDQKVEIFADKGKIERVLINIIDNAAKYTEKGGHIKLFLLKDENYISLQLKDNGVGIPKEDVARVFERFYRVDKARSKDVGGTGLGLSIVKHIVLLHQGSVNIKSDIGQGTEILIEFPCS